MAATAVLTRQRLMSHEPGVDFATLPVENTHQTEAFACHKVRYDTEPLGVQFCSTQWLEVFRCRPGRGEPFPEDTGAAGRICPGYSLLLRFARERQRKRARPLRPPHRLRDPGLHRPPGAAILGTTRGGGTSRPRK